MYVYAHICVCVCVCVYLSLWMHWGFAGVADLRFTEELSDASIAPSQLMSVTGRKIGHVWTLYTFSFSFLLSFAFSF